HLGHMGDLVEVKPGYGRNYLLPKGLAIPATAGALSRIEHERRGIEARRLRLKKDADTVAKRLEKVKIEFARAAGEDGKLFGSVTSQDVQDFLAAQGLEIERKRIHLSEPIKALGQHDVPVKLHSDVSVTVKVWVTREGEPEAAAE
ncbi:MAG: 50S ribosomal protein L9, partial [Candidatus Methylomirabilis sp.]|nr:50S ribosomal protein L9 [Deltaproteobacteria bacterium]